MYTQIEGDFWKEKLNLLQKQNMRLTKKDGTLSDIERKVSELKNEFPSMEVSIQKGENFLLWTISPSADFKIRVYHQNHGQSKITFQDRTETKIADARFPNELFGLIAHFLRHFDSYRAELEQKKIHSLKYQKQQEIAYYTACALLSEKFDWSGSTSGNGSTNGSGSASGSGSLRGSGSTRGKTCDVTWSLKKLPKDFSLTVTRDHDSRIFTLTLKNFINEIENLQF